MWLMVHKISFLTNTNIYDLLLMLAIENSSIQSVEHYASMPDTQGNALFINKAGIKDLDFTNFIITSEFNNAVALDVGYEWDQVKGGTVYMREGNGYWNKVYTLDNYILMAYKDIVDTINLYASSGAENITKSMRVYDFNVDCRKCNVADNCDICEYGMHCGFVKEAIAKFKGATESLKEVSEKTGIPDKEVSMLFASACDRKTYLKSYKIERGDKNGYKGNNKKYQ